MEQRTSFPPFPDTPLDSVAGWADAVMWLFPALQHLIQLPIVVAIFVMLVGQVCAVTFGEWLKSKPGFTEQRAGDWKFQLRSYPIVVGTVCTFILLYQFLDLEVKSAGGWMILSALNGAAAWPVFDKVVEPYILPAVYKRLGKLAGVKHDDLPPPPDVEPPDNTNTQIQIRKALDTLKRKGYLKDET